MKFSKNDLKGLSHALLLAIDWQIEKCHGRRKGTREVYVASQRVSKFRRLRKMIDSELVKSSDLPKGDL